MSRSSLAILAGLVLTDSAATARPARGYLIQAAPVTAVELADGFWRDRIRTNSKTTIPHVIRQCETTGRIDNFARAAGLLGGEYTGFHFNDSDVYKLAEGISIQLATQPDDRLRQTLGSIIGRIAAAQQADGYIHPYITLKEPAARWRDPHRHELFSIGHLIEAGAVHFKMTGSRDLLDVAIRAADRVAADFQPEAGPLRRPPEHQQIEIGLVRLFEATGEAKYLALSKRFLEARGRATGRQLMGEYCQDHQPVADQRTAVGHAVRALYQYSAMADHAAYSGEAAYRTALDALWQDVFGTKAYLTGGIGASGGNEGFAAAYDLPNATAYSETCASIGSIMWNERMFRLTGEGRFMDLVERTLFNALLSGVSLGGDRFFYPNRLESFRGTERSEWFDCACCPSNVVRFLPTVPALAYAQSAGTVYVNQFINSKVALEVDGQTVTLRQVSDYPWNGGIRIEVDPTRPARFTLMLRLPGWARGEVMAGGLYQTMDAANPPVGLKVNGGSCEWREQSGYARITRDWQPGDIIELDLPMPVRRIVARAEVTANEGRVAFQRGPVVYCAEGRDQPGGTVMDLMIEDGAPLQPGYRKDLLQGQHVISGKARQVSRNEQGIPQAGETVDFLAIPYYAWAHRGATPMQVWLARTAAAARPAPRPTIASTSIVRTSNGASAAAVNDQLEPRGSEDQSLPFFHWWPKLGTTEWIDYEFPRSATITGAEVYWFDDSMRGGACRIPQSWRVLRREGDSWQPVAAREVYTIGKDRWSRVSFQPVTTTALRLEVVLQEGFSAGVHEWKLEETVPPPASK
jgi:DUF1680 family protein